MRQDIFNSRETQGFAPLLTLSSRIEHRTGDRHLWGHMGLNREPISGGTSRRLTVYRGTHLLRRARPAHGWTWVDLGGLWRSIVVPVPSARSQAHRAKCR